MRLSPVLVLSLVLGGCAENPEDERAAREIHRQLQAGMSLATAFERADAVQPSGARSLFVGAFCEPMISLMIYQHVSLRDQFDARYDVDVHGLRMPEAESYNEVHVLPPNEVVKALSTRFSACRTASLSQGFWQIRVELRPPGTIASFSEPTHERPWWVLGGKPQKRGPR